jgi:methyltransferase-like protein 6
MESINSSCDYFSSIDQPKILTPNEINRLQTDKPICEFKRLKLEREASINWDKFYRRNRTNFFKDRHWTKADLQDLCPDIDFINVCQHKSTIIYD